MNRKDREETHRKFVVSVNSFVGSEDILEGVWGRCAPAGRQGSYLREVPKPHAFGVIVLHLHDPCVPGIQVTPTVNHAHGSWYMIYVTVAPIRAGSALQPVGSSDR